MLAKQKNTKKIFGLPPKYFILGCAALLIIVVVAVYFSIAWYQDYKFKQVEQKMDRLQSAFIAELGQPIYQTKDESCGYSSVEFGRGRLGCGISQVLFYGGSNQLLKEMVSSTQNVLQRNNDSIVITFEKKPTESWNTKTSDFDVPADDLKINNDSCQLAFNLYDPSSLSPRIVSHIPQSENYLQISLDCSISPLRPIFPVADDKTNTP